MTLTPKPSNPIHRGADYHRKGFATDSMIVVYAGQAIRADRAPCVVLSLLPSPSEQIGGWCDKSLDAPQPRIVDAQLGHIGEVVVAGVSLLVEMQGRELDIDDAVVVGSRADPGRWDRRLVFGESAGEEHKKHIAPYQEVGGAVGPRLRVTQHGLVNDRDAIEHCLECFVAPIQRPGPIPLTAPKASDLCPGAKVRDNGGFEGMPLAEDELLEVHALIGFRVA